MTAESAAPSASPPWWSWAQEGAASRPIIVAAAAITTGWFVAVALTVPDGPWLGFLVRVVPVLLLLPILVLLSLVFLRPRTIRPGFLLDERVGFFAPASWGFGIFVAVEVLLVPNLAGQALNQWLRIRERRDLRQSLGLAGIDVAANDPGRGYAVVMSVAAVVFAAAAAVMVAATLSRLPRLQLTPDAIELHDIFGSWTFPWNALQAGLPARIDDRHRLALVIDRPELVVRRGVVWGRQQRERAIWKGEARFLLRVIQHYADRPERREEIGTAVGHKHVLASLG